MISLFALDPHWLESRSDPRDDQCAHGHVLFEVNGITFVCREDGALTLSAAALFLLRTLDHDHTVLASVAEGNQLFPCCGFNVWLCGQRFPVFVLGCPAGADVEVRHIGEVVEFTRADKRASVSRSDWE